MRHAALWVFLPNRSHRVVGHAGALEWAESSLNSNGESEGSLLRWRDVTLMEVLGVGAAGAVHRGT